MKPIHLQVAACVVLIVPFVLISHLPNEDAVVKAVREKERMVARYSKVDHALASNHFLSAKGSDRSGSSRKVAAVMQEGRSVAAMEPAPVYTHADPDEASAGAVAGCGSRFPGKIRLPAVQLATNAKFPAVFMARVSSQGNSHEAENPAVKTAREAIEGKFYQELARNSPPAAVDTLDDGDTVIIGPGPVLEDASKHADEQFRSLFGNDAYNRHAMDSAKEVMLPAEP